MSFFMYGGLIMFFGYVILNTFCEFVCNTCFKMEME